MTIIGLCTFLRKNVQILELQLNKSEGFLFFVIKWKYSNKEQRPKKLYLKRSICVDELGHSPPPALITYFLIYFEGCQSRPGADTQKRRIYKYNT